MFGKYYIFLWFITTFSALPVLSQIPQDHSTLAEEMLYQDESSGVGENLYEELSSRSRGTVNLNLASKEELAASGLFTPFQIHNLVEYREQYGILYSIYELAGITGFREEYLRKIAGHMTVEGKISYNDYPRQNRIVMFNVGQVLPRSAGYLNSKSGTGKAYRSSPLKASLRLRTGLTQNLSLALAYEKDPGETFYPDLKPEFLSGYIGFMGKSSIRQLVFGSFRLHQGLGLVNGSGFFTSPEGYLLKTVSLAKLVPYASLNEYSFYNGVACRVEHHGFKLIAWGSFRLRDLSAGSLPDSIQDLDWTIYHRKTGLHRTAAEIAGQSLSYSFHSGIQALVREGNLKVGLMLENEMAGLTKEGMDSLRSVSHGSSNQSYSIHYKWQHRNFESSGEIASGNLSSLAILNAFSIHINDFIQGLLLFHNYSKTYHGIYPSAYCSGSNLRNEKGVAFQLHTEPGRSIVTDVTAEYFIYPNPRYKTRVPSTGFRYRISLLYSGVEEVQYRIRLSKKLWQTTPEDEHTGIRKLKTTNLIRLDLQMIFNPATEFIWHSRMVFSRISVSNNGRNAYAGVQRITINPGRRMKWTAQFLVFNVPDWENRIYLYEPGFYYDFNFPVCYGKGQKVSSVLNLKPSGKLTLACKVSVITYQDRDTIGTGNEKISGNKKWDIGFQMRIHL